MALLETRERNGFTRCNCCQDTIRPCEKFLQVLTDEGKVIKGERYCHSCRSYAFKNNDIFELTEEQNAKIAEFMESLEQS